MKTMMKNLTAAGLIAIALIACERDELIGPGGGVPSSGRTMNIEMTDAPANFARMDVEIKGVDVYHDTRGWITLNSTVRSVNILSLANGVSTTIASGSALETGHYSMVRLHFGENNTVKLNAGATFGSTVFDAGATVKMGWGFTDRYVDVRIDANISSERGARVLLDFNAQESVRNGIAGYIFTPSVSQMYHESTGVRGRIEGATVAGFIRFSNEQGVYSAYTTVDGRFLVRGMRPGTYHATITVMKRNPNTGLYEERTYERDDISVRDGEITTMGSIIF